jgi:hypothetical protein
MVRLIFGKVRKDGSIHANISPVRAIRPLSIPARFPVAEAERVLASSSCLRDCIRNFSKAQKTCVRYLKHSAEVEET